MGMLGKIVRTAMSGGGTTGRTGTGRRGGVPSNRTTGTGGGGGQLMRMARRFMR